MMDAAVACILLVAVLSSVHRVRGDDDSVADDLLDDRRQRLEVEPQRDLDGLVATGRRDRVAARTWRGQYAQPATGSVRRPVDGRARIRDEDPARVGRRQ